MKSKDFKEAIKYYSESLKLNPNEASTYANRAQAHIKLKDYTAAKNDANKSLEIDPDYLKAYYRRGMANQ